jgi:signal transduction histidine kinase
MQQSVPSDRMVYLGVVAPLLLAIALLLALCIGGFSVLSAVRTYVGGESLWSKARATAVTQLRLHALNGHASEYRRYVDALSVPLGDRAARLELDKPKPDMQVIEAGFLAGENAPEDIPSAIRLYRYFRHVDFMEDAVLAWAEGDRLIEQLQTLGERIHAHVERGDSPAMMTPLVSELDALDARLVTVEKYFSATLGRASRKAEQLLIAITLALALLLALGGALFVRRAMRLQLADRQLLVEANQRWDLAADAAGIGLFEWHIADDRFVMDARAAALYGAGDGSSGATFRRSEIRAMTHPDDQAFVRQSLDQAVSGGGILMNRYRVQLPGDGVRHVEAIGRVRDWDTAERARMVGILRDVGGEVAQAQLTVDKEAAERVSRRRVEFLARLSHELRTPLNAVLGVAQLLRIDPLEPLTANQAKRVQILQDSGTQLLRLIEDVLDITRIDSGTMDLQAGPADLLATVRMGLNIIEPERAASSVRIEDRMPQRVAMVKADPERLRQVFVNLLSNGCKYNARGGRLSLSYRDDERNAWVTIADEGPGMTAGQMADLFEPFKRLAPDVPGTGLGLVVVKLLLEQMHGSVLVESEPGRGSCFTVRLLKS